MAQRFAIITRVLDGHGLRTDSGTHGQRGQRGDYLFAWLGCTTPLEEKVWRVMAQLGSRLFFLVMDSPQEVTVEDLVGSDEELSYKERLAQCKRVVHQFLTELFAGNSARSIPWTVAQDPRNIREWIARLAMLLAAMRSEPVREVETTWGNYDYTPAKPEQPRRAYAVLRNIARGHALVHGRQHLRYEDLPLVAWVTVSTMPSKCAQVFPALVQHKEMTVSQVQVALGVRHHATAQKVMEDLDRRGVLEYVQGGPGKPALLRFRPEWEWCTSPEFRAMLGLDDGGELDAEPPPSAQPPALPACLSPGYVPEPGDSPLDATGDVVVHGVRQRLEGGMTVANFHTWSCAPVGDGEEEGC